MSAHVGEQLLNSSDYSVLESDTSLSTIEKNETEVVVNKALVSRIELLESQNDQLQSDLKKQGPKFFRIENISKDDSSVKFYTGFISYEVLFAFFQFLGPAVNSLRYWGTKIKTKRRKMKLDPINQFFLTLVKLRLNLRERDLALRFGISLASVSKYFITWVCFLYHHFNKITWMPSVEQVRATLPYAFKEKYPDTYTVIDGSEVLIEKPSDLHMQSSTWSDYKHHNPSKFLLGCTPNGAVMYMSPLYVGSISDVELTRVSGFIDALRNQEVSGMSVMADRGFTIKDQVETIGAKVIIPPFLEGRQQLPPEEVQAGRHIASLRIHVECVIGRVKNFSILKGTLEYLLVRAAFPIKLFVCALLVNFQPVFIQPPTSQVEDPEYEVETYFESVYSTDSDYDVDTEFSDED